MEGVQLNPLTHEYGTVPTTDIENVDSVNDSSYMSDGDTTCSLLGDRSRESVGLVKSLESPNNNTKKAATVVSSLGCGEVCGTHMSIIANTANALLGVSIFAMPWGFEQAGLIGGTLTICLVAPLSYETARVLLVAQRMIYQSTGQVKNYPEIASDVLGKKWALVVKIATVISCLGGCVGYLIFLGEVCGQLFGLPLEMAILAAVLPLMLLSWIRSFQELAVFTLIGVFAIIISCGVVMIDGLHAMRLQHSDSEHPKLLTLRSAPNFLGPATFLYTIHYCVLSMGAETLRQTESLTSLSSSSPGTSDGSGISTSLGTGAAAVVRGNAASLIERRKVANTMISDASIARPLAVSYALSSLLIILVGSSGYFTYGAAAIVKDSEGMTQPGCESHVCQNIILNLSPGPLRDFAGFALVVAIVLSYVIILAPAREHIEATTVR